MATTVIWSVLDMVRETSSGGVKEVTWQCVASTDTGENAVEGGKLRCTPDASSDAFIAYEDLTEAVVLGWVYDSLIDEAAEETAAQAKARVEAVRVSKAEGLAARTLADSRGKPWGAAEEE